MVSYRSRLFRSFPAIELQQKTMYIRTFCNGSNSIIIQQRKSQLLLKDMARYEIQEVRNDHKFIMKENKFKKQSRQEECFIYEPEEKENNFQNYQILQLNAIIQNIQQDFMTIIIENKNFKIIMKTIRIIQNHKQKSMMNVENIMKVKDFSNPNSQSRFKFSDIYSLQQSFIEKQQNSLLSFIYSPIKICLIILKHEYNLQSNKKIAKEFIKINH
ncbi:unnamed protein product [Paramecium pentaurelia]|uniref:Uncharacterized protein n=1 Tax=Paramecium pentaurelia TaxID=43138 RepID=A0A8S1WK85_9CILI|nr:unnamed protein product [Paramecium pentaurelia]